MDALLTVTEAVKPTSKSRRTITRLANRLEQAGADQVMREKRPWGYNGRISRPSLQDAFGATAPQTVTTVARNSTLTPVYAEPAQTLAVARQGSASLMTMHQAVEQAYTALPEQKGKDLPCSVRN